MAEDDFFSIPGSVVQEAEAAAEFTLVVPETAKSSPRSPDTFFWNEGGRVISAESEDYVSPEGLPVKALTLEVTIDSSGSGMNISRPVNTTFRISKKALDNKGPKNLFTMSLMSVNKLKGLMTSIGVEPDLDGGGYSKALLSSYFPTNVKTFGADASPLINQDLYFTVKQAPYQTRDGETKKRAEIHKFLPRE